MNIQKIIGKLKRGLSYKQKSALTLQVEQLTPPQEKNWNYQVKKGYQKKFSSNFIELYFPYLLRNMRALDISTDEMSLLDIGCGWAPMAIPFVIFENAKGRNRGDQIAYLGIDIREDAISWLSRAYRDYPFVSFQCHQANKEADYIDAQQIQSKTHSASDGEEANFKFPQGFVHNVQWSSSVFTHLTPQACAQTLKSIRSSCIQNSMQVNTWLIIDCESQYALAAAIADRELPFDCGDFLTYSEKNPLVCTAYKIEAIERMYAEVGLEIVRIDRGAWRGPAYKNQANHYQDIIISRPFSK
jgi:hypothetical protein